MADAVRSAGSLVGAVLESVGYHYQGLILDQLSAPMQNEVGGLIYLLGIVVAIAFIATQGSFKMGTWLLIGPPMFFAVILPRQQIPNARWEFNFQTRDQPEVNRRVREILATGRGGAQANVSKLFARYVELISATVREMVFIISSGRRDDDLWFVMRAELFAQIHTPRLDNMHVRRLIQGSLFGDCGRVLEAARAAYDPLFRNENNPDAPEYNGGQADVEQARTYFRPTSRDQLEVYNRFRRERSYNLDDESARAIAAEFRASGDARLVDLANNVKARNYSCEQIWSLTLLYLERLANQELQALLRRGEAFGIQRDALLNIMEQAHGIKRTDPTTYTKNEISAVGAENVRRIIMKYILKNESRDRDKSAWMARWITRHEVRDIEGRMQGVNSSTEQARLGAQEWSEKERLMHAAGNLPYYQGLGLYFLGATFPFFALLLLMPGKHAGFLIWFSIWMWLKSWDVALAVIMLLDDTLFAMLSVQKQSIGQVVGTQADKDMALAFASIGEMDPTFNLSMYYTIMATCILAIPPTTAQLILGSMRSGATLMASGIEKSSTFFSKPLLKKFETIATDALKGDAMFLRENRLQRYQGNIEKGLSPFAGAPKDSKGRLEDPMSLNPVAEYTRPAGGAQGGPDGKPGTGISYEAAQKRLQATAEAAGRAEGLGAPLRPGGGGTSGAWAEPFLKTLTAGDRNNAKTEVAQAYSYWGSDQKAVAGYAAWDADLDAKSYEIHRRIAIYGGIPIPWSNFNKHDSEDAFNRAVAKFTYEREMTRANWAATREVTESFIAITSKMLPALTDNGKKHRSALRLDDVLTTLGKQGADTKRQIAMRVFQFFHTADLAASKFDDPAMTSTLGYVPANTKTMSGYSQTEWNKVSDNIFGVRRPFYDPGEAIDDGMSNRERARAVRSGSIK